MVRRRIALATALVVVVPLGVSRWNPLAAAGANNQLESRCSRAPAVGWVYDRASWTPLRWSCTVTHADGTEVVIRPDLW